MYRTIEDFLKDWQYEKEMTLNFFSKLSRESLTVKTYTAGRELGYLAWHLVLSMDEMAALAGAKTGELSPESDPPGSLDELKDIHTKIANEIEDSVKLHWLDEDLLREIEVYGEKWKVGYTLAALIKHNIHHRGQMSVVMRQAGLTVPGAYGPSREEWSKYNQPAPR